MTPALAFLMHEGRARMVCIGCTAILIEMGMVKRVKEIPMRQSTTLCVLDCKIADGFTTEKWRTP